MAVTKQLSIREQSHIANTIEYVLQKEKTEFVLRSGINCLPDTAKYEFEFVKKQFNKKNGLQGHHVIQSFKPGEVLPDEAHKIGKELAEKIAPGYQAVVATHIDKEHIHNHIVINSVNMETGYKYDTCKAQYRFIRQESDRLCKEHNLTLVKPKENSRGIDQATYHIAVRGESWKVKLAKTIDEAIESCNSKNDFITYMESMGYEVKWQNVNISFKDPEHEKFIRSKRLGENYTKEMIENRLRRLEEKTLDTIGEIPVRSDERNRRIEKDNVIDFEKSRANVERNKKYSSEYERYQQYKRRKSLSKASSLVKSLDNNKKKDDTLDQEFKVLAIIIMAIRRRIRKNKNKKRTNRFNFVMYKGDKMQNKCYATSKGNDRYLRLTEEQLSKLLDDRYSYSKEKIKIGVMEIGSNKKEYLIVFNKNDQNKIVEKLGNIRFSNLKLEELDTVNKLNKFIKINESEFAKLKEIDLKYIAFIDKDNNILLNINNADTKKVLDTIKRNSEIQFGNITYKELKKKGNDLEFRVINGKQFEELIKYKEFVQYAAFMKDDLKINIAFSKKDKERISKIINQPQLVKNKNKGLDR